MTPPAEPLSPTAEFLAAAAALGVEFEPGEVEKLGSYLALLLKAAESFNLTSVTDPAQAWMRHVLDSLTLVPLLAELPDGARVIDVGSGGGLPGIPLAIVLPRLRFMLLEATGKKAAFLRGVVLALGLENVSVVQARAEAAGQDRGERIGTAGGGSARPEAHREVYDAVVARAVGRLATLAELTVPLARVGGRVLLIKGQKADEELAEAAAALKTLLAVHEGTVDTPSGRIVVLGKRSRTPRTYPRRDGEPGRAPLGVAAPKGPAR
ncbi:MAG: 16S rRNA (guanine(527)-N(7))-methyltransferase RsmG [Phycisphaerales bacterium]|nr:16S rRNA (guanine(527)-N(7))-methyltransferase RsmG [Phycisphaerales bacterium]